MQRKDEYMRLGKNYKPLYICSCVKMKKNTLGIGLILIVLSGFFCQAYRQEVQVVKIPLTTLKFDSASRYEANVIYRQGKKVTTFTFTNTGKNPLKITAAEPNCPCVTVDWSQEEIAPGKQGFVRLSFLPYKLGNFLETVNVLANVKKGSETLFVRYHVTE